MLKRLDEVYAIEVFDEGKHHELLSSARVRALPPQIRDRDKPVGELASNHKRPLDNVIELNSEWLEVFNKLREDE